MEDKHPELNEEQLKAVDGGIAAGIEPGEQIVLSPVFNVVPSTKTVG